MKNSVYTFLVQVFAFAVAGVTVGALLQAGVGAGASAPGERPRGFFRRIASWLRPHAGGLAVAVAVIAAAMFWTQTWAFWVDRSTERRSHANLSAQAAAYADISLGGASKPFLEFVRARLKPGETYAIAPAKALADVTVKQWTSYVLVPNLLSDEEHADAIVIYSREPRSVDYDRKRFPVLEEFQRGYAIALRRKSGAM